jgi:hypothetical protein
MDVTNVTSTSTQGAQQAQGHHHHHRMSMSQRVDKMESLIDQAVKDGKLTDDQATSMKKQLDDIKSTLSNAKTSGTALTDDQRKQIGQEMHDIGKQLFSAVNPGQGSAPGAAPNASDLFSKMDANGDGKIDKDELTSFINQMNASGKSLGGYFNPSSYNQQGNLSVSTTQQSTISITA